MTTLNLPAPFDTTPAAGTENGTRLLTWTLTEPGELYRNRYDIAWVTVRERGPWDDSRLYVTGQRRAPGKSLRDSMTEGARTKLTDLLLPAIEAAGFGDVWLEVQRTRADAARELCQRAAGHARQAAKWWDDRAALAWTWAADLLAFEPVLTPAGERPLNARVLNDHGARPDWQQVAANARNTATGVVVGYMTVRGELVPTWAPEH